MNIASIITGLIVVIIIWLSVRSLIRKKERELQLRMFFLQWNMSALCDISE